MDAPATRREAEGTAFEHLWHTPSHWPRDVHYVTMETLGLLGFKPSTHELFWDGHPLVTKKEFTWVERSIAIAGLFIGAIGVAAACVQAYAAMMSIPPHS